jgi:hypothetical protein
LASDICGREVLASSALLLGAGLAALALAPGIAAYTAAWLIIGLGMSAGLSMLFAATVVNVVVTLGLVALSRPSRVHS